jgi:hypothetical protein
VRVESQARVPVEQAQLIDPGAFRFDTSGAKAIGQIGAVLTELQNRKQDMQDKIAVSNVNASMDSAQLEYQQEIASAPMDKHAEILQKHVNKTKAISGQQRMSPNARKLADNKLQIWGESFAQTAELATIKAMERDALIRVSDDMGKALVDAGGDANDLSFIEAEDAFDEQAKSSYTPAEAKRIKGKILETAAAQTKDNVLNSISDQAFAAWEATVSPEDPDGDLNVAFDMVDNSGVDGIDKQDVEAEVKSRVTNRRAESKLNLEAKQEKDLASINQLMFFDKNYAAADQAIKNSSLTETQKKTLFSDSQARATAAAKGVPLANDRVVENELYEMSLDIWRGNVSKKEFDDALIKKGGKLDDPAYQRVTKSAADTLKTSQAQSLSRADSEAADVLVNFKSEDAFAKFVSDSIKGKTPDAAKLFEDNANEIRQLQFNNLAQYNAEARQWVADNPDKSGKEFFQFKEGLKHEYWNKNIDDLRQLRKDQNIALEGIKEPPAPPTINTQAQYDALPSGTEYIDANGARGTKP